MGEVMLEQVQQMESQELMETVLPPSIIKVAIVEDRIVTERWSTFLDPGPNSRVRVAGIDLAGQPTFADVALRLTDMLQDGVLVAHNAPFDVAFLVAEYKRVGLAMPEVSAICTLRLARRLRREVRGAHGVQSAQRVVRAPDADVQPIPHLVERSQRRLHEHELLEAVVLVHVAGATG